MIRNVLLPEKIGSYHLFAKRVIGFDINRIHVTATKVLFKGSSVTIEQSIEEKLDVDLVEHHERIAHAIKTIINQMPKYNEVRTAISSSVVVFKELHMPFSSHEQIKMAVEFEVDPLLPFSAQDAIIDFIITKVNPENNSADILVAAVQKHHIAEHLQPFELAGVDASVITVDLFALYGLYKRMPAYQATMDDVALIDLGSQTTGIGYIKDHRLSYIRSLPSGVNAIVRAVSKELNIQPGQAIREVIGFGINKEGDPKYTQAVSNAVKRFWKEVQFTVSSFMTSAQESIQEDEGSSDNVAQRDIQGQLQKKQKVILLGMATDIEGLASFLQDDLGVVCELFDITSLTSNASVRIKTAHPITSAHIMSVSIALSSQEADSFNLRQKEFTSYTSRLLLKQLIMGIFLLIVLFGSLATFMFLQVHNLKKEADALEEVTIEQLKQRFKSINESEDKLEQVIESAEREVVSQEKLLSAFLQSSSSSVLTYLLELTDRLNAQELGLEVSQIAIKDGKIIFKGKMRNEANYAGLRVLEQSLAESSLFKIVSPPQEVPGNINMVLELKKRKSHGVN